MSDNELLLDPESRGILAAFLFNKERPLLITPENFQSYKKGEKASIPFRDLGQIVDVIGAEILDQLAIRGRV